MPVPLTSQRYPDPTIPGPTIVDLSKKSMLILNTHCVSSCWSYVELPRGRRVIYRVSGPMLVCRSAMHDNRFTILCMEYADPSDDQTSDDVDLFTTMQTVVHSMFCLQQTSTPMCNPWT